MSAAASTYFVTFPWGSDHPLASSWGTGTPHFRAQDLGRTDHRWAVPDPGLTRNHFPFWAKLRVWEWCGHLRQTTETPKVRWGRGVEPPAGLFPSVWSCQWSTLSPAAGSTSAQRRGFQSNERRSTVSGEHWGDPWIPLTLQPCLSMEYLRYWAKKSLIFLRLVSAGFSNLKTRLFTNLPIFLFTLIQQI